jgi:hypothetical protein
MQFVLPHVARTVNLRKPYRGLAGKPEEKNSLLNLIVDGRIIL